MTSEEPVGVRILQGVRAGSFGFSNVKGAVGPQRKNQHFDRFIYMNDQETDRLIRCIYLVECTGLNVLNLLTSPHIRDMITI